MKRKTRLQPILFAVVVAQFASFAKGAAQTPVAANNAAAVLQPSALAQSKRKWPHLWSDLVINLISMPEIKERKFLPEKLLNLIVSNQPQAGDLLLCLIADPKHSAYLRATNAFLITWETMNPSQIRTYFRHAIRLSVMRRESYPQGVKASVGFGYDVYYNWSDWPT